MSDETIENLDLRLMNRMLRHRLRNLCAGVTMTVERVAQATAETQPKLSSRCAVVVGEMDNLRNFTERLDLLFDALPEYPAQSLLETANTAREFFVRQFPFCAFELEFPPDERIIPGGGVLAPVLRELLANAGEAAMAVGGQAVVNLACESDGAKTVLRVRNNGELLPEHLLAMPPTPFKTEKGRHDGIGLAIAWRMAKAMGWRLKIANDRGAWATVEITIDA